MKSHEFIIEKIKRLEEGWSQKYKSSINCSHPKGFSQRAHCAGKKKHNESVVMEMVEKIPDTIKTLNSLTEVELTEEQKMDFALKAIGIRFDKGNAEVLPQDLLIPLRDQYKGNDLWSVFNVVQEKLVRGGFKYTLREGRRANRTARRISNFTQDIRINEQLFDLAKSYANA